MDAELIKDVREKVQPVLRELLRLAEEKGLSAIEWERDGVSVALTRVPKAIAPAALPVEEPVQEEVHEARLLPVLSELVGIFRAGGGPHVGDEIAEGQVLAHIESMRLMNEVKAPGGGRLAEILVEDGHPIEYGQPLMFLEMA